MADNNNKMGEIVDELDEHLVANPSKKMGFLPLLLKWIAIIIAAIIFIVTVVVITVMIMNREGSNHTNYPLSEEYRDTREILQYYQGVGTIKTNTADPNPGTVVVGIALGYPQNDKAVASELSARLVELKDYLRHFFQERTLAELGTQNEQKLKIEIRNGINDTILSKTKIRDVLFTQYDLVQN